MRGEGGREGGREGSTIWCKWGVGEWEGEGGRRGERGGREEEGVERGKERE